MEKRYFAGAFCAILLLITTGCAAVTEKTEKVRNLEYTVVKEEDIPEALREQIEEKKANRFKLTYEDGEYLYIASGYGEQETGGYCIEMEELYLSSNAIYFSAQLYGPQKGENVTKAVSYPYIVIKLEDLDQPVVFD